MAENTRGRYEVLVEQLLRTTDATQGGTGFGSTAMKVDNKIFALLSSRQEFVVKLPRKRVADLVEQGHGQQFDPGHGRLMTEWLALAPESGLDWAALATEAMAFVRKRPPAG